MPHVAFVSASYEIIQGVVAQTMDTSPRGVKVLSEKQLLI